VEVFIDRPSPARRGRKRKRVVSSEVDTPSPGSLSQSFPYHTYPYSYPYSHPHTAMTSSPSHVLMTQSQNPPLPPPYLPQSPMSLPPTSDAQVHIAQAMQHLAAYLMQSSASNAWPPPPIPPLQSSHQNNMPPHWPGSTSDWQTQTPPHSSPETGRPRALVSRSRSRGRRVSFKLEAEVIPINKEEEEGKSQSEDDLVGKRETANLSDVVKADTPRRGGYSRAQTPGPPSRDVTPSPSSSINRRNLSPRKR
jgi:hypothetical protein